MHFSFLTFQDFALMVQLSMQIIENYYYKILLRKKERIFLKNWKKINSQNLNDPLVDWLDNAVL